MLGQGELESYGIEDCRVARIGQTYYLTFTEVSEHGVGVGLRSTTDWRHIRQHGMIFPPTTRTARFSASQSVANTSPCTVPAVRLSRELHLDRRIALTSCIGATTVVWRTVGRACGIAPASGPGRPHPHAGGMAGDLPWRQCRTPLLPRRVCCWIWNPLESPRPLRRANYGTDRRL